MLQKLDPPSLPLYFSVKQKIDMIDCPPVWYSVVDHCLVVNLVEKIQYLCALFDDINCFHSWTHSLIPSFCF